eukprot:7900264-Pyramimonas_sp.AAC.1
MRQESESSDRVKLPREAPAAESEPPLSRRRGLSPVREDVESQPRAVVWRGKPLRSVSMPRAARARGPYEGA